MTDGATHLEHAHPTTTVVHRVVILDPVPTEVDGRTDPVGVVEVNGNEHLVEREDVELELGCQHVRRSLPHPLGPPLEIGTSVALLRELLVEERVPAVDTGTWVGLCGPRVDELRVAVDHLVVEPLAGSQPANGRRVDLV